MPGRNVYELGFIAVWPIAAAQARAGQSNQRTRDDDGVKGPKSHPDDQTESPK